MNLPSLSPEEREVLNTFEKGRRLTEVVNSPGWKDVLDIMEQEVIDAEFDLWNYAGSDKDMIALLHRRVRAKRESFQNVQIKIQTAITAAESLPELIRRTTEVGRPGVNLDY